MKTKSLSLILCIALIALFSLVSVSAFNVDSSSSAVTFTEAGTQTITLSGDLFNLATYTNTLSINGKTVTITPAANTTNVSSLSVSIAAANFSSLSFGTYTQTAYFNVTSSTNSSEKETIAVTINLKKNYAVCSDSNPGELDVGSIDMSTNSGFGDDDSYWYPLDEVEVSFDVENNGDYDMSNIGITACLWDVKAGECVMDEDDMDLSDDEFDLDSGDDTSITITLTVDPDNLNAGNNDYIFYVGATGEIDDSKSSNDGDNSCASSSKDIDIRTDDNFVILSDIEVPESATCGVPVDLSFQIWNIGSEDLDSDEVYVGIYNKELGVDEVLELSKDLDSFDSQSRTYTFNVPNNAAAKTYNIQLSVYDDADAGDSDLYQNSEDDESVFNVGLKVENCKPSSTSNATISAELSDTTPKAVIGNQVVIEATVKNTGNAAASYSVEVAGNSAWSQVATIDPKTFTLNAGESKKVSIYLDIANEATEGEKEFTIRTTYNGGATEQKVQLSLEKGLTGSSFAKHIQDNWVIYLIVVINVILIIAIIAVIVRISRKQED